MSELKAGVIKTSYGEGFCFVVNDVYYDCDEYETKFYLKSEADKVIEDKDKEIETQKRLRDMALASVPNVLKVMRIIQHHKHKRCLAMARWCESELLAYPSFGTESPKERWWQKWHKRWLDIAEKFKR